ncbi:MAG: TM0106 family RecB-like putative nuclease [Mycobacterium sp.]
MFVDNGRVFYSASDLATAAKCPYALLREFDYRLGRGPAPESDDDELLRRTIELGDAHERRILDRFVARHGVDVVQLDRPAYTEASFTAAARATVEALARQPSVVYQAALVDGRFVGFADFLVRDDASGAYQVRDTKLARHAKIEALLQIAGYAEALRAMDIPVAPAAALILGDGSAVEYPVDEIIEVYRRQRAALQDLLDHHFASGRPVSWADEHVRACLRCAVCEPHVRESDDVLQVAGMRVSQRAKLMDAGIGTLTALAEHTGPVHGMAPSTLATLVAQARMQVRQKDSGAPEFEVIDAEPLGALPATDDGDLFFDFEGDPLWTADGVDWGLEYLFGVLERDGTFHPLWAHDRSGERAALVEFLAMVRKRRKRYPHMHIYHYAAYEKTALLRLAARHGVGEDEVDDLLRSEVLVNLYPIVRKAILVGTQSYGLKALEPLYMGDELRVGDVTTAAGSITQYARYCALRDVGREEDASGVLKDLADYNRYDCTSTRKLRDWLVLRSFENGVTHLTRPAPPGETVSTDDEIARTLTGFAGDASDGRSPDQTAAALVNAARGYYQRERKPFWWNHFDRLTGPVEEWADTSGVFRVESARVEAGWHLPPGKRKPRRHVRLTGSLCGGMLDTRLCVLYGRPAPRGLDDAHPDRRAAGNGTVIDTVDAATGVPVEVLLEELQPDAGPFDHLPMALTPGFPVSTDSMEQVIETVAAEAAESVRAGSGLPGSAVIDILRRNPPTLTSGDPLPRLGDDISSITAALLQLTDSYVAVHGPPGTGKTHNAARVIARLVNEHQWRVGVVAQSHAVVENLFDKIVEAGVDPSVVAKKPNGSYSNPPPWQLISENKYADFINDHAGCVIGGTAWDFANAARIPPGSLDVLTIDEAGQFSLASTVAVSRAARNLLLLGDPQQLPEVSTGTHPERVDCSALGWLLDGRDVLPDEFGYFLEHTYRMHPAVCQAVSALSYDNRLLPDAKTSGRVLAGYAPGIHTVCVDHSDNDTSSGEEAVTIVSEICRVLGAQWTDGDKSRKLTQHDVLVVAPYNAQVLCVRSYLDAAGLSDVRVGTVDKFQGRQAPVVFVSMAASSIEDVPRGMSFLLNRNRLNVAVSRAQYASVIVRSPSLTEYLPTSPDGLVDLGAFLSLAPC